MSKAEKPSSPAHSAVTPQKLLCFSPKLLFFNQLSRLLEHLIIPFVVFYNEAKHKKSQLNLKKIQSGLDSGEPGGDFSTRCFRFSALIKSGLF